MKKILYVFDDINYESGAQKVMLLQMASLSKDYQMHAFSLTKPEKVSLPKGVKVIGEGIWESVALFSKSLQVVWKDRTVTFWKKLYRLWFSVERRLSKKNDNWQKLIKRYMKEDLEEYAAVIVVSEASKLRSLVMELKHPKKIQWIHTDYALWSEFSGWTRAVTRKDAELYRNFDWIVTLSEYSRKGMLDKLPELEDKTVVIPNLIDGDRILERAEEKCNIVPNHEICNLITVGRLEKEKAYDRILDICNQLRKEEKKFCWYIVGDGSLKKHLEKRIDTEGLQECVKLLGRLENPYSVMKQCDYFVLLSEYEGTPVTIDEAMVLGVPVIATDVGGIREQLERGKGNRLVQMGEALHILQNLKTVEIKREKFFYQNSNTKAIEMLEVLLEK